MLNCSSCCVGCSAVGSWHHGAPNTQSSHSCCGGQLLACIHYWVALWVPRVVLPASQTQAARRSQGGRSRVRPLHAMVLKPCWATIQQSQEVDENESHTSGAQQRHAQSPSSTSQKEAGCMIPLKVVQKGMRSMTVHAAHQILTGSPTASHLHWALKSQKLHFHSSVVGRAGACPVHTFSAVANCSRTHLNRTAKR